MLTIYCMTCVVRPQRGTNCTYAHIRICSDSSARLARERERARPPEPTADCAAHLGCGSITFMSLLSLKRLVFHEFPLPGEPRHSTIIEVVSISLFCLNSREETLLLKIMIHSLQETITFCLCAQIFFDQFSATFKA